jgi:hypothetical protein
LIDIDECTTGSNYCDKQMGRGTCNNTAGSYSCGCTAGYSLASNGYTCNGMLTVRFTACTCKYI